LFEDGTLALIVLSLDTLPSSPSSNALTKVVGDIRKIMADDLAGSGSTRSCRAVPVMQLRDPQRGSSATG